MKKFLKNYYYILLPIGITIFMLTTCHLYYAAGDDGLMMEIASSNVPGSENLVCMNVLYGYIFKGLYTLIPEVNWFAVVYVAVLDVAMIMLFKLVKDAGSQIFAVGVLAVIEAYLMIRITFTALAFISCTAAIMWVVHKVERLDKKSIIYFVEAFFIFIAGFAMRGGDVFYCVLLLFVPFYVFAVRRKSTSVGAVIMLLIVCTAASYGTRYTQKLYRSTIPDETYFNQFQEYRAAVTDYGYADYEANADMFQQSGITQNDVAMAADFLYADKSVFTREMLKTVQESKSIGDKYTVNIMEMIKPAKRLPLMLWYLAAMIVAMIVLKKDRKEILLISLFVFGAIGYLFIRQRAVARVVSQIAVAGIIMLLFVGVRVLKGKYLFKDIRDNKLMAAVIACLFVFNCVVAWGYHIKTATKLLDDAAPVLEYIKANPDNKYICTGTTRQRFINRELTFSAKAVNHKPVYDINGDWYTYSAYWYSIFDTLDLMKYSGNTFSALLEPDVMYISYRQEQMDMITTFLKEHYDIDSEFQVVEEFEGTPLKVYSLVKKD